ncbi:YchJ family protein [Hoeflea alexandrii]|uniref:YchJ family protein n=1 Tax=Hoeflea alexandrii TaxID=288436 RepID=UPI0022AF6F73|nr:YchJ family protein [Hoeflea alexandrii]MCZ4288152.1 YchJ family protein [Hoeflea alexandrii]
MPPCPCGSALDLYACCGRFHAGEPAPTAEALMRSRYAAYALGRLDYIAATCAGQAAAAFDLKEAERSQLGTRWLGLEISGTRKGRAVDDEGTVSFIARYSHNGAGGELRETSRFRRIEGRWLYWDRLDEAAAPRAAGVGRNDPCPCGSGKKCKKCCG